MEVFFPEDVGSGLTKEVSGWGIYSLHSVPMAH